MIPIDWQGETLLPIPEVLRDAYNLQDYAWMLCFPSPRPTSQTVQFLTRSEGTEWALRGQPGEASPEGFAP